MYIYVPAVRQSGKNGSVLYLQRLHAFTFTRAHTSVSEQSGTSTPLINCCLKRQRIPISLRISNDTVGACIMIGNVFSNYLEEPSQSYNCYVQLKRVRLFCFPIFFACSAKRGSNPADVNGSSTDRY